MAGKASKNPERPLRRRCRLAKAVLIVALVTLSAAWAANAQATNPEPRIVSFEMWPSEVASGEPIHVRLEVTNDGGTTQDGYINLSFPDGGHVRPVTHDATGPRDESPYVIGPGEKPVWHYPSGDMLPTVYTMVETRVRNWPRGTVHYLEVEITPPPGFSGTLRVYVRASLTGLRSMTDIFIAPTSSTQRDQQNFPVLVATVLVQPPTPTATPTVPPSPTPTATETPAGVAPPPTTVAPSLTEGTPTIIVPTPAPTPPTTRDVSGGWAWLLGAGMCMALVGVVVVLVLAVRRVRAQQPPVRKPKPHPLVGGPARPPSGGPRRSTPPPGLVLPTRPPSPLSCPNCGAPGFAGTCACGCQIPLLQQGMVLEQRYRIERVVGLGGMGAVYRVSDLRIAGKVWALKQMRAAAQTPQELQWAVATFHREAQMLASLRHPNLPAVSDRFDIGNSYFLVMEFIKGVTLGELTHERCAPLSEEEVRWCAAQLCDVLAYLHGQSPPVIFRDMKPGNVMLQSGSGTLKLIDFGIARLFKPGQTRDTVLLGTPGYAAPEQYGTRQTDPRADVYGLGVTLHTLLTGYDPTDTPFQLPPVRTLRSDVSAQIEFVITRATELDPMARFQTVEEMRHALGI